MNEIVGRKLRQAREAKTLSLEQASAATFIRTHILSALEEGNFNVLPSAAQVRGFLRAYAEFLELNPDELFAGLEQAAAAEADEDGSTVSSPTERPPAPMRQMENIFAEIGEAMHTRREMLGLTFDEIEAHTHIPAHYLGLIERGEFNRFPSPTQARGMLGNYADFLDMDSNAILLRYADALQARLAFIQEQEAESAPQRAPRKQITLPLWLRNIFSIDMLIFGVVGLAIILFTVWGIGRILSTQASMEPEPTAPSLSQLLLPSPTGGATATFTPLATDVPPLQDPNTAPPQEGDNPPEDPTPAFTLQPFAGDTIQLYIIVRQRAYLRVVIDGEVMQDGRVAPGTNLPFTATQQIEVLTGNGAALQVFLNDQDLGPMGIFGEVVNVLYTREGMTTPTATITPTLNPAIGIPSPSATPLPPTETIQP